jgi:hypothetical protein
MATGQQFYEEEEAEQILKLAASKSAVAPGAMSRDRLLATAAELGISPDAVAEAEHEYRASAREANEQAEFEASEKRDFFGHVVSYLIVSTVLGIVYGGGGWSLAFIVGWGAGVLFHAIATFIRSSRRYRDNFAKWKSRRIPIQAVMDALGTDPDAIVHEFVRLQALHNEPAAKLNAVKYVRERTKLDLKEAKDLVDGFAARNPGHLV